MEFVNLHVHTSLGSMLDALVSADELFDRAAELGQCAVAITDHGTLASHYDGFKAYKRTGIKFLPGCEGYFVHSFEPFEVVVNGRKRMKNEPRKHIIMIAQNARGYKNLLKSNYEAFKRNEISMGHVYPRLGWDILEENAEGVICTSACGGGILAERLMLGDYDGARKMAERLASIYEGRFFLEIQPHHLKVERVDQELINDGLIRLSRDLKLPLVTSSDSHYLTRESEPYHDMLLAIRSKKALEDDRRMSYGLDEFYIKGGQEIHEFLTKNYGRDVADEAVANTVRVAGMCDAPDYLAPSGPHLPTFPAKDEEDYGEFLEWQKQNNGAADLDEDAAFMRFRCFKGFREKFAHMSGDELRKRWERVKYEVGILEKNKFSSYMMVVSDYIRWAKQNDILVGVGRGSVGGSLVGYLLDIHGVDPFEYGLLFERFQNAEKTSLPDIDTDFAAAGRDRVEEYVRQKYGYEYCAQVSNFLTYKPKNVIDDVARSMRLGDKKGPGEPDDKSKNYFMIAKMIKDSIPADARTIDDALERSEKFREFERKYPKLIDYAKALLGKEKGYATHAAGMVVSDVPIVDFAPLRVDKNGITALQYEKERCEEIGLVKMDFLGLTTLDVIAEALKNIERLGEGGPKRMEDIPLDDAETYEMISRGLTKCVFQLGKTSMMAALCKRIRPRNIFDIAIINALGRPSSGARQLPDGTIYDERKEYIARRNKEKPVSYIHPSLKCLEESYGLCVMEEQLMGVAKNVAGWDLNKADKLRKFTKKKDPEMAKVLSPEFVKDVVATHGVDEALAMRIWKEVVEGFGGYGFNRSHAVFYSINGYYTAYLKRHHPAAFLAAELKIATMKNSITSDDEIESAKQECRRLGIKILPPDVNRSSAGYEVLDSKTIVMGLAAVKGLGDKGVKEIVDCQPFESFIDFLHRVNARVVNKSKVAALAKAGCFECFKVSRKFAHDEGKSVRDKLKRFLTKREKDGYDAASSIADFPFSPAKDEWDKKELLTHERDVLGECLSGDFNDMYNNFFTGHHPVVQLDRIKGMPDRAHLVVEVLVKTAIREFTIKKKGRNFGKKMIKYNVEDINGIATELTVWPAQYALAKRLLKDGTPIRAHCQVSDFNGQKTLMLMSFQSVYGVNNGSAS